MSSSSDVDGSFSRNGWAGSWVSDSTVIVWPISPKRESSRRSSRPLTVTITSSSSLCPCSASVRGKTVTSIDDSRSSSTNTAIWSPFLVNLRPRLVITPPTSDQRPVVEVVQIGDRLLDLALQRRLDSEQRVVGHVEAEHLLLVAEAIALVELDVGDRQALVEPDGVRCRAGVGTAPVAEQAHHALVALAPADHGGVDHLLEHRQQAAPRMTQTHRTPRP